MKTSLDRKVSDVNNYDLQIIARRIFIIVIAFLTTPAVALGDMRQFIPRIYSTEGNLEINMSHESRDNLTDGKGLKTSDTFFSEKIVLAANGFVYHPRFILFLGKVGGGFSQEKFSSNSSATGDNSWRNVFIREYEFRMLILPEHPYNLELFALRYNPFIVGRTSPGINAVNLSKGAIFTYKKRPVAFNLRYIVSSVESDRSTSETKTFDAFANYFKEHFSLSGGYSRSTSTHSLGSVDSESTFDNYSIGNQIRLFQRKVFLSSDASQVNSDQQSFMTTIRDDRFTWTEELNMYLPWNFNTIISYGRYRDTEKSHETDSGTESTLTSNSTNKGVTISQTLYDSLRTTYNFNYNSSLTSTGNSTVTTHSLNSNYTKKIPWGTLNAGIFLTNSVLKREGSPTVINDVQHAPIFGDFTLQEIDIDEASIEVRVVDPVDGVLYKLTKDIDYSITPIGNTFNIFIKKIPIPLIDIDPNPNHKYEFRVRYVFLAGALELDKPAFGYNLKLALFDSLINPYYAYFHEKQKVLSGTLPGGPDEVTSHTFGVLLQKRPYTLSMEYQNYDSRFNPVKRYKAEATYRQYITLTTSINARVYHMNIRHLENVFNPTSSTETSTGTDVMINRRYPRKNLLLTAVGSYAQRTFNFKTLTYSLGASVTWSIANLDLSLGANMSRTETDLDTGKQEMTNQYYYLTMKRKLF
jgi:hypothetical protein